MCSHLVNFLEGDLAVSIEKNIEDFEEALKGMKIEPEMMDEDSSVARIDELGNQVHNLSCFQDDEYLSEKLDAVAMTLWELAQQSCH